MLPSLPQQDPSPGKRRAALARAKHNYPVAHVYRSEARPAGSMVAGRLSPDEQFPIEVALKVAAVDARLLLNHSLIDLQAMGGSSMQEVQGIAPTKPSLGDYLGITRGIGSHHQMFAAPFKSAGRIAQSFPENVEKYKEVFRAVPTPQALDIWDDATQRDQLFSWYRLAGNNPYVIQGIRKIPTGSEHDAFKELVTEKVTELERLGHALEEHLPAWARAVLDRATEPDPVPSGEPTPEAPDLPGVLPKRFPVTNEIYQQVMGRHDSLEKAAAEHRLYMADYRLCDNLPQGTWTAGVGVTRDKYIYAPMALFAWRPGDDDREGELVAVAIQCHQRATLARPNPIFTPHDGTRWQMATAVVQCADANHHEMVSHLGLSHMVMEAIYVSARNTLAPHHPLMLLLAEHCAGTLAINDYATKHLIAPGGQVDVLFGSTLSGTLTIMARALSEFRLDRASPIDNLRDRLVDDTKGLPQFPFRDDALSLFKPFAQWIASYVELYYARPQDIAEDHELQAFLALLAAKDGGNISGVPNVRTVPQLCKLVATMCWTSSGHHSAVNYTQFPFMGYPPAMPLALYAEAPVEDTPENDLNWLAMIAPTASAVMACDIAFQLSGVKWRAIGQYPDNAFEDHRVKPLLDRMNRAFKTVEAQLRDRDKHRFMSYPYLFPSNAQNSIFI